MFKLSVIGNLGSDAELRNEQGSKFVKMSIAHTDKRKDANGNDVENTQWISATINGDGGELLQYLKKGTKVYAYGDAALRVFHSEKERRMVAGINLFVRNIELVGGTTDEVPRDLYDLDGVAHRITKYYYSADVRTQLLYDRGGREYQVDQSGWVIPVVHAQPAATTTDEQNNQPSDPAAQTSQTEQSADHLSSNNGSSKGSKS